MSATVFLSELTSVTNSPPLRERSVLSPASRTSAILIFRGYHGYLWDAELWAYHAGIGMFHETTQLFSITHE
jgi:hypothetical protein